MIRQGPIWHRPIFCRLPSIARNQLLLVAITTIPRSCLPGRVKGRLEPVRGQDDRKRELHARDGVWLPAGGRRPAARGCPGSRHTPSRRIVKGQIGVWTGLIIPAPIWREGRDSPSGLRSHGWRSEAFPPWPAAVRRRWTDRQCLPGGTGSNRIKSRESRVEKPP